MSRLARLLLSALGIGFLPGPAGTWASLATTAALVALHGPSPGPLDVGVLAAFAAGVLVTIGLAGRPARAGDADPSWVVSDEVAGQALAIAVAGSVPQGSAIAATVAAFVLFRTLDILKPGPVGAAERLPGGVGVLADDLVAGLVAGALVAGARVAGVLG